MRTGSRLSIIGRQKIPSAFLATLFFFTGCVPATYRARPDFHQKRDRIKIVGVLPPRAEVFQRENGEIKKMDDSSIEAEKNLLAAILKELKGRPRLVGKTLPERSLPDAARSNLEETHGLFKAVSDGIQERVYRDNQKIEDLDYTLSEKVRELRFGEADAILIVSAVSVPPEPGAVVLGAIALLLLVAAPIAAAALRAAVVSGSTIYVGYGATVGLGLLAGGAVAGTGAAAGAFPDLRPHVSVALADARKGIILWYNRDNAYVRLADADSASNIIKRLLNDLPLGR